MIQYEVFEGGFVELQGVFGNDLTIVNAARTSFLGESKGIEADKKLLRYLYVNEHLTPFEMVEFRYRIRVPLVVWWQLVRHRTFSFSLQSGRYVEFDDVAIHHPRVWRKQSASNKQGSSGYVDEGVSEYFSGKFDELVDASYKLYQEALSAGIAKEQARMFLPAYNLMYTGIVKADARNLMNFFKLRRHSHAQAEIHLVADQMYTLFAQSLPWTAELFEEQNYG